MRDSNWTYENGKYDGYVKGFEMGLAVGLLAGLIISTGVTLLLVALSI